MAAEPSPDTDPLGTTGVPAVITGAEAAGCVIDPPVDDLADLGSTVGAGEGGVTASGAAGLGI
ncbi:MAG: hypothetical protein KDB71_08505 [Mycobacterium sp.]|nr:hypothetical protein [Mycobacterium sp.]